MVTYNKMVDERQGKDDVYLLLVDDEEAVLDVNTELLETLGYHVFPARTGREAVEIYKRNSERIALVLLDMIMPEMSGLDTFHALKTINPDIKVILLSGYSFDDQAKRIMKSGCHAFIQKPFKISLLDEKIQEALKKKD